MQNFVQSGFGHKKCRGQGYNITSVMSESYSGVQTRIIK